VLNSAYTNITGINSGQAFPFELISPYNKTVLLQTKSWIENYTKLLDTPCVVWVHTKLHYESTTCVKNKTGRTIRYVTLRLNSCLVILCYLCFFSVIS